MTRFGCRVIAFEEVLASTHVTPAGNYPLSSEALP